MAKSLYLKKFMFILSVILLFTNVFAQGIGCCYSPELTNGFSSLVMDSFCESRDPSSFDPDDPSCQNAVSGCACNPDFEKGGKFLSYDGTYASPEAFFQENNWDIDDFTTTITTQLAYADEACDAFCQGSQLVENMHCEATNPANQFCGYAKTSSQYPWCCIEAGDTGVTFASKQSCLAACEPYIGEYELIGNVKDEADANIENVIIVFSSSSITKTMNTDSSGNFEFTNLPQDTYELKASKSGYQETKVTFTLNADTQRNLVLKGAEPDEFVCAPGTNIGNCNSIDEYDESCCNPVCGVVSMLVLENEFIATDSPSWSYFYCNDNLDNNCNGIEDADEDFCEDYAYVSGSCGDGIAFNSVGEECDGEYYCSNYCDNPDNRPIGWDIVTNTNMNSWCKGNAQCILVGKACGDGIYNPIAEDCDNTDPLHKVDNCLSDCTFAETSFGCDSNADCTANPGGKCIDGYCQYPPQDDFDETQCIDTEIPEFTLIHLIDNSIRVEYEIDGCADGYTLYKVESPSGQCNPDLDGFEKISLVNSKDYNIQPDTIYCYKLEAIYPLPMGGSTYATQPISTGPDICFQTTDTDEQLCDGNSVVHCNLANEKVFDEDCEEQSAVCINKNNDAQCVYQSDCDFCNIIYGVSPYEGYTWFMDIPAGEYYESLTLCEDVDSCYRDYNISSVDKYKACSNVESCYDYKTLDACENNPCQDEMGECLWSTNDKYSDLGIGVCIPVDPLKQDCSQCDENNGIFSCSKDICGLYGECYYAFRGTGHFCLPKFEVGCTDFDTYEDCVNSDSPYSDPTIPGEQEIELFEPSNAIKKASHDYFAFQKCKWNDATSKCYKDSNDNNKYDCSDQDGFETSVEGNLLCAIDNYDPVTSVSCPDVVGDKIHLDYSVNEPSTTYFSIVKEGSDYVKPSWAGSENYIEVNTNDIDFETGLGFYEGSGNYNLNYYSKDINNNPEVVQTHTFYVDANKPTIDISYTSTPNPDYDENIYVSDLNIDIEINDDYPEGGVICSSEIYYVKNGLKNYIDQQLFDVEKNTKVFLSNLPHTYSDTLTNLPDNQYILKMNCTDKAGNTRVKEELIKLVADDRISNILPQGTLDYSVDAVTFDFKFNNGNCRAQKTNDNDDVDFDTMPITCLQTQPKKFSCIVNANEDGVYNYVLRCKYTDDLGEERITDSNGHVSSFAIDTTPPELIYTIYQGNDDVTDLIKTHPEDVNTETLDLDLECYDPELVMFDTHWNYGFDQCSLRYRANEDAYSDWNDDSLKIYNIDADVVYDVQTNDSVNIGNYDDIVSLIFDFEQAQIDLDVYDTQSYGVDVLYPGDYMLRITSSKPMQEINEIEFSYDDISITPNCMPFEISNTAWCFFSITNTIEVDAQGQFDITITDTSKIESDNVSSGRYIMVNSLRPDAIAFLPELDPFEIDYYPDNIVDLNDKLFTKLNAYALYAELPESYTYVDYYDDSSKQYFDMTEISTPNLIDDYTSDNLVLESPLDFVTGKNDFSYTVHNGPLLRSDERNIELNHDKDKPRVYASINTVITNIPELNEYYYEVRDDYVHDSRLNTDSLEIVINDDINNIPGFNNNEIYSAFFTQSLEQGNNDIIVRVDDKATNNNSRKYQMYYDPNALMINSFIIYDSEENQANKVNNVLYQGYTYNDINVISNAISHDYNLEFSHAFDVSNIVLNQNTIENYNVVDNLLEFNANDSLLVEGINVLTITATRNNTDLTLDYDLLIIYDNQNPSINAIVPSDLTKGMSFDVNSKIENEVYDINVLNITMVCKENTNVRFTDIKTLDNGIFGYDNQYHTMFDLIDSGFYNSCTFTFYAEDAAGNSNTTTIIRNVDAYAPNFEIIEIVPSSLCADDLSVSISGPDFYTSQCNIVDVVIKLGKDAEFVSYDKLYESDPNENLIGYEVDIGDLDDYDENNYRLVLTIPLDLPQPANIYSQMTNTELKLYARDSNPLNSVEKDILIRYRDKFYSAPPVVDIRVVDLENNEVQALSFNNYVIVVSSDTKIKNNPISITYNFDSDTLEDSVGFETSYYSRGFYFTYDIDETDNDFEALIDTTGTVTFVLESQDELGNDVLVEKIYDFDSVMPILNFEPGFDNDYYENALKYYVDDVFTMDNDLVLGMNSSKNVDIQYTIANALKSVIDNQEIHYNDISEHLPDSDPLMIKRIYSSSQLDINEYSGIANIKDFAFADTSGDIIRGLSDSSTYPNYGVLYNVLNYTQLSETVFGLSEFFYRLNISGNILGFSSAKAIKAYDNTTDYVDKFTNFDMDLKLGTNEFNLGAYDYAFNFAEPTALDVIYDNQLPVVVDYGPKNCIDNSQTKVYAKVLDFSDLSRLNEFELYHGSSEFNDPFTNVTEYNGYREYYIEAQRSSGQNNDLKVYTMDKAGNAYEFEWNYYVNELCDFNTQLNVDNSFNYNDQYILNQSSLDFDFVISDLEDYTITNSTVILKDKDSAYSSEISSSIDGLVVSGNTIMPDASVYNLEISIDVQSSSGAITSLTYDYTIVYDNEQPNFIGILPSTTYSGATINAIAQINPLSGLNQDADKYYDDYNIYESKFCFNNQCHDMLAHDNLHHNLLYNVPELDDGNYPYTIIMTDLAGNIQTYDGNINIDNKIPSFTYTINVPANKKVIQTLNYTLTNSNTAEMLATLSSNTKEVYYARDNKKNFLLFHPIELNNKQFSHDFGLVDGTNIIKFKLIGESDMVIYQDVNISVDKQAPVLQASDVIIK